MGFSAIHRCFKKLTGEYKGLKVCEAGLESLGKRFKCFQNVLMDVRETPMKIEVNFRVSDEFRVVAQEFQKRIQGTAGVSLGNLQRSFRRVLGGSRGILNAFQKDS